MRVPRCSADRVVLHCVTVRRTRPQRAVSNVAGVNERRLRPPRPDLQRIARRCLSRRCFLSDAVVSTARSGTCPKSQPYAPSDLNRSGFLTICTSRSRRLPRASVALSRRSFVERSFSRSSASGGRGVGRKRPIRWGAGRERPQAAPRPVEPATSSGGGRRV